MTFTTWQYKDKSRVRVGDAVTVSKKIAKEYGNGDPHATVIDLHGFVTVQMRATGDKIDLDMRSITKS